MESSTTPISGRREQMGLLMFCRRVGLLTYLLIYLGPMHVQFVHACMHACIAYEVPLIYGTAAIRKLRNTFRMNQAVFFR